MCKGCIDKSIEITGQRQLKCPLCKTVNSENPLDFQPLFEESMLIQKDRKRTAEEEQSNNKKRKTVDFFSFNIDEFIKEIDSVYRG